MSNSSTVSVPKRRSKKWEVVNLVVDGTAVELREIPFRRLSWGHTYDADGNVIGHPKEQKLYEARLDGAFVALVARPHGFGKQAFLLERVGFEPNEYYLEGLGYAEFHGAGVPEDRKLYTLERVAERLVEERRKTVISRGATVSSLPTPDEFREFKAAVTERKRLDEEESERERKRFWKESNERILREEQSRLDTVGGLEEILQTFGGQLSNYQRDALLRAIENASTPSGEYTHMMIRRREKELDEELRASRAE